MDGEPLQEGLCNRSGTEAPHVVEEKDLELYSQRRRELPLPEGAAAGGLQMPHLWWREARGCGSGGGRANVLMRESPN